MSKPLRVLIVEHSVYDCMEIVQKLRRGGFEPRYERVETADGLTAALGRGAWDVVIASYAVPGFDALAALRLVRAHDLDLPFVVVAESSGEEPVVAVMRAGAQDYVLKQQLAQLAPAVERALAEAQARRARKHAETPLAQAETIQKTPPPAVEPTRARDRITVSASGAGATPEPASQSVGRYRVLATLGEGGMGTVYRAHDPQLDRVVAVKVPRFDVPQRDRDVLVQRFLREARAAASIRHPNVCPIYDVGEEHGVPFVVMAYVEGRSLAEQLRSTPRYAVAADAVRLVRQVACALEAVHSHGIVHRDLKPGNILIDRDGQAVLTDFGLARPEADTQGLTVQGAVLGTPGYMAPEQASGDTGRVGPWTDIYSLGVVLYAMLTGRLPFQGSAMTMLAQLLYESPPAPSTLRPDLDPALEAIVLRAIARRPADRYQSGRELVAAVDVWLTGRPTPAPAAADSREQGAFLGEL